MIVRGRRAEATGFETTAPGTVYWTLSLYVEADKVAEALNNKTGRIDPAVFRRVQRRHLPSLALSNAIDPLLNDIADRETHGEVQEFLLAATEADPKSMKAAATEIRRHEELIFQLPASVSWTTEGVRFHAHPPGLDDERMVRLRRYWLSHNNGALSYHMAFSHFYGSYVDETGVEQSGHDPATYYFLSLLQKLAAPKEYALPPEFLQPTQICPDPYVDVFSDQVLNIDPLDRVTVRTTEGQTTTFWPFVKTLFEQDALSLFIRLAQETGQEGRLAPGFQEQLLDLVPFIEVPGLKVPKSRFMFLLHDPRFFDKLMPLDPDTHEAAPRKLMVRQGCFEPYQTRIAELTQARSGQAPTAVHLGPAGAGRPADEPESADYWDWVCHRPDYRQLITDQSLVRRNPDFDGSQPESTDNPRWHPFASDAVEDLASAMRSGDCFQLRGADGQLLAPPVQHHVPAFEASRSDCLDYLFLAGFNQNIIDFMNQDTSEILDSIDPIYPDSSEQSDERFFVRYANHRAMITYVPMSRSLEIGNDYIGTCPYAFLIHALALHNEFLARTHEQKTMLRIERIEAMAAGRPLPDTPAMHALNRRERLERDDRYSQAEMAINQAKLAEFSEFERFRHANPFRYDTERDVFDKLEELRGISRKTQALSLAISSLEDHASDLQRRHQKRVDAAAAKRGLWLSIVLGGTGFFGAGQMMYWIGEKAADTPPKSIFILFTRHPGSQELGNAILSWTEIAMTCALAVFVPLLAWIMIDAGRLWVGSMLRRKEPDYAVTGEDARDIRSRDQTVRHR